MRTQSASTGCISTEISNIPIISALHCLRLSTTKKWTWRHLEPALWASLPLCQRFLYSLLQLAPTTSPLKLSEHEKEAEMYGDWRLQVKTWVTQELLWEGDFILILQRACICTLFFADRSIADVQVHLESVELHSSLPNFLSTRM